MRKTTTGLLSLALAAGLGATMTAPMAAASATKAPSQSPLGEPRAATPSDSLPDPIADKQAELRKTAVSSVLKGEAKPQEIGGSTVVKVGESERAATAAKGTKKAQKAKKVDQYVELARENTDQLFVLVVQFGNQRHPDYPDQDTDPNIPGPTRFDGPAVQPDPRARPRAGQLDRLERATTARPTTRTSTSATAPSPAPSRCGSTTRSSPPAATPSTAWSPTG